MNKKRHFWSHWESEDVLLGLYISVLGVVAIFMIFYAVKDYNDNKEETEMLKTKETFISNRYAVQLGDKFVKFHEDDDLVELVEDPEFATIFSTDAQARREADKFGGQVFSNMWTNVSPHDSNLHVN